MKLYLINTLILIGSAAAVYGEVNINPVPETFAISANVLGLLTQNPTVDIEYRVAKRFTIGLTAWWEVRAVEDRWGQVKITYYFDDYAMNGFGLGLTGGAHRAYRESGAGADIKEQAESMTVGILASYTWRLGDSKNVFIAPVAGIKRTFSDNNSNSPLMPYYAEARLNIGFIF
jgi:hypothetical protein